MSYFGGLPFDSGRSGGARNTHPEPATTGAARSANEPTRTNPRSPCFKITSASFHPNGLRSPEGLPRPGPGMAFSRAHCRPGRDSDSVKDHRNWHRLVLNLRLLSGASGVSVSLLDRDRILTITRVRDGYYNADLYGVLERSIVEDAESAKQLSRNLEGIISLSGFRVEHRHSNALCTSNELGSPLQADGSHD